ncbi:MAG: Ig-like domain-containing protein, partial [Methylococcaceae bacterium]
MTSIDKTAPKLVSASPQKGGTAIAVNQDVVLTFNEAIQLGTGNIIISNGAGDTIIISTPASSPEISISGAKVTLNPAKDLLPNSHYTVKIDSTAIQDLSGNKYAGIKNTTTLYFDTVDTLAPRLVKSSPLASASSVATNSNIVLTLSENIKIGTGNITLISGNDSRTFAITDKQIKISGTTLTINPSVDFNIASTYKVHLDAGAIKDLAPVSNHNGAIDFSFTTKATSDKQAPVLQNYSGKGLVSDNLQLTFQENIKIGKGSFTLVNSADSKDKIVISATDTSQVSIANNVLTINPKDNLKPETTYLLSATKGVLTDLAKNAFAGIATKIPFTFDTRDKIAPTLTITDDKTSVTNSAILYTFTASEAIKDFSVDDITVTGGSKAATLTTVSPTVYTLSVTPTANSTTPVTVSVAAGKFTDLVNNGNLAAATSTQEVDTAAPMITITDDKTSATNSAILYTLTANEAIKDFSVDDITVTGGSK